jgi:PKD repeat protein
VPFHLLQTFKVRWFNDPGVYDVTLIATNADGSDTLVQTALITVVAKPFAQITPGVSNMIGICPGDSIQLFANVGPNFTYEWYYFAKLVSTDQSMWADSAGTYKVKVTDPATGCTKRSGVRFVESYPRPNVFVFPPVTNTICQDDSVLLATVNTAGYQYQWYKGSSVIPGAVSSDFYAKTQGYYRVELTNTFGCKKKSGKFDNQILVNPAPNAGVTANGPLTFCVGDSVILEANSAGNSYQWELNFSDINGETDQSYIAYTPGKYTVTVTGTNGCTRRSGVKKVIVNCRMGVDPMMASGSIHVYPNPAVSLVNIDIENPVSGSVSLSVFDITGKMVETVSQTQLEQGSYTLSFDASDLQPGIYFLKATGSGWERTAKMVVDR